MSDCCSKSCDNNTSTKRQRCPISETQCKEVSTQTILHHIKEPWSWQEKQQVYYFCEDTDCDVVYFGQDNSVITTNALRTSVGVKEKTPDALLCYCFDVSFASAAKNPDIKQFVIDKTKSGLCACETRNPSGKCCLKDFPKH